MSRLSRKDMKLRRESQIRGKKNKRLCQKLGIQKEITGVLAQAEHYQKAESITDTEFSNLVSDFGLAVTKALVPNAKVIKKPDRDPVLRRFRVDSEEENK